MTLNIPEIMSEIMGFGMTDYELLQYADDMDSAGFSEDYIVNELARVMNGGEPLHYFAHRINAGTIRAEKINISSDGVFTRTEIDP